MPPLSTTGESFCFTEGGVNMERYIKFPILFRLLLEEIESTMMGLAAGIEPSAVPLAVTFVSAFDESGTFEARNRICLSTLKR